MNALVVELIVAAGAILAAAILCAIQEYRATRRRKADR